MIYSAKMTWNRIEMKGKVRNVFWIFPFKQDVTSLWARTLWNVTFSLALKYLPRRANVIAMFFPKCFFFFKHHNLLHTPTYTQQVTHDSLPTTNQVTPVINYSSGKQWAG